MVINKQDIGKQGEEMALDYLLNKDYSLVKKNWRFGKDEVDIIMEKEGFLVFVEVKTRSTDYFGQPQEFVTKAKQHFILRAANAYIEKYNIDKEIRFDVVAIILNQQTKEIKHIKDAFNAIG